MKAETYSAIRLLLSSDGTVDEGKRCEVLAACSRVQRLHRKLVTTRKVAEMLECHTKTVARYVRRGILRQVKFSLRKVRYDLDEVEAFARDGLDAVKKNGAE